MKNHPHILAAPIDISTVTEENRATYVEMLRSVSAKRVWLCGTGKLLFADSPNACEQITSKLADCIEYFTANGFEVGAWVRALGFGDPTKPEHRSLGWTRLRSVTGVSPEVDAYCPDDPGFRAAYMRMITMIAECGPRLIMLDDDLCLSVRPGIGCFCDRHLAKLSEKLGETIEINGLAEKIFTGGSNKYRDAWLDCSAETLSSFCAEVRKTAHKLDPTIRLGFCAGYTSWDIEGIDAQSLTRVLAGENKPFLRFTGAPYWCNRIGVRFSGQRMNSVIECVREQLSWCDEDIEVFAENDSYPRPAHQVSAKLLEELSLVDAALGVDELKYFFDYFAPPEYERLYLKMHRRNSAMYNKIREVFAGLTDCGVRLYRPMRTIGNDILPATFVGERRIMRDWFSSAAAMLTQLGIPVCYSGASQIGAAFGHDAQALELENLPKKLIIDLPAAKYLQEHGIDVGLRDLTDGTTPSLERFGTKRDPNGRVSVSYPFHGTWTDGIYPFVFATLSPDAQVESEFDFAARSAPASYRYSDGNTEFLVLLFNAAIVGQSCSIEGSYCRARQIADFIGGGFPFIDAHPGIYALAKRDDRRMCILFVNLGEDPLFDATIELGLTVLSAKLYGADATLSKDRTCLTLESELTPGSAMLLELEI